jgi:heat shock protein HslJ
VVGKPELIQLDEKSPTRLKCRPQANASETAFWDVYVVRDTFRLVRSALFLTPM